MISVDQYLALSAAAYANFGSVALDGKANLISQLIKAGGPIELDKPELLPLKDMGSWTLLNFHSVPSTGFAGAAFRSPDGQIVIAFRGSDDKLDWVGSNAQIATSFSNPTQFEDAERFVYDTLVNHAGYGFASRSEMFRSIGSNTSISLTGHSLGGGLAQYAYNLFKKYLAPTYALALQ